MMLKGRFLQISTLLLLTHLLSCNPQSKDSKDLKSEEVTKPECACKELDARRLVEKRIDDVKHTLDRSRDPNDHYAPRVDVYVVKMGQRPDCSFLADIRIKYVYSSLTNGLLIPKKPDESREMRIKCDGVSVYIDRYATN